MTNDETILTADQVRSGYAYDSRYGEFSEQDEAGFDQWLSAVKAEARNMALDEAALAMDSFYGVPDIIRALRATPTEDASAANKEHDMSNDKPLMVMGWSGFRTRGDKRMQTREIMVARSGAEVMRATGMTRSEWAHSGGQTWNDTEIATASAKPGTIFFQSVYARPEDGFFEAGA